MMLQTLAELMVPKILHHGADDAFAMVKFSGKGEYRLDVVGTTLQSIGASLYVFAAAFAIVAVCTRYGGTILKGLP